MSEERKVVRMWVDLEVEMTDRIAAKLAAGIEGQDEDGNAQLVEWDDANALEMAVLQAISTGLRQEGDRSGFSVRSASIGTRHREGDVYTELTFPEMPVTPG